jgi:CHRD domain-containing protein
MKKAWLLSALTVTFVVVAATIAAVAVASDDGGHELEARLSGFNEVPALSTNALGSFELDVGSSSLEYKLSYDGLSGSVLFAHIHFAQRGVNGGVVVFLCGGGTKPDPCPQSGTVTGTITAADVIDLAAQGIAPGEFDELVRLLKAKRGYANVHSSTFPSGELRGQIEED